MYQTEYVFSLRVVVEDTVGLFVFSPRVVVEDTVGLLILDITM